MDGIEGLHCVFSYINTNYTFDVDFDWYTSLASTSKLMNNVVREEFRLGLKPIGKKAFDAFKEHDRDILSLIFTVEIHDPTKLVQKHALPTIWNDGGITYRTIIDTTLLKTLLDAFGYTFFCSSEYYKSPLLQVAFWSHES